MAVVGRTRSECEQGNNRGDGDLGRIFVSIVAHDGSRSDVGREQEFIGR